MKRRWYHRIGYFTVFILSMMALALFMFVLIVVDMNKSDPWREACITMGGVPFTGHSDKICFKSDIVLSVN